MTLPLLIRAVVIDEREPDARRHAMARFESVEAALARIGELSLGDDLTASTVERARALYTQRASQLAGECRLGVAESDSDTHTWLSLRLELLRVERGALTDMRDRGEISNALLADLERDLDLEESRLEARMPVAA